MEAEFFKWWGGSAPEQGIILAKIRILLGRYPNWSRENWKKHT